jgi:nicotinamidase-related amidase
MGYNKHHPIPEVYMLETTNTVLLIIDVQEKLVRVMHDKDSLLSNLQKLIEGIQVMGIPVIVTEQYPQGLGPTVPEITNLISGFSPISKTCFSCWDSDDFRNKLEQLNRKQVLISGIEGHVCVYQTARDLVSRGYETYFITDTISSRTPENRQLSFKMMKQRGAYISGTETVLFELLKSAGSDQFKKISRIVK